MPLPSQRPANQLPALCSPRLLWLRGLPAPLQRVRLTNTGQRGVVTEQGGEGAAALRQQMARGRTCKLSLQLSARELSGLQVVVSERVATTHRWRKHHAKLYFGCC